MQIIPEQKIIRIADYCEYYNFFNEDTQESLSGQIKDGWILKEIFLHIKDYGGTFLFERYKIYVPKVPESVDFEGMRF